MRGRKGDAEYLQLRLGPPQPGAGSEPGRCFVWLAQHLTLLAEGTAPVPVAVVRPRILYRATGTLVRAGISVLGAPSTLHRSRDVAAA